MAIQTQKIKILYIMKILHEKTDEDHVMTASELMAALSEYGISAERKSIYSDIEALQAYGLDIVQQKEKTWVLYGKQAFELAELVSSGGLWYKLQNL